MDEQHGMIVQLDNGGWQQQADYIKALELFRRLTTEFTKGETRYYDQALQSIKEITDPTISVTVSNVFLPESELQFALAARNIQRVDFALYRIDLTRDVRFTKNLEEEEGEGEVGSWIQKLPLAGRVPVKTWSRNIDSKGDHRPYNEQVRIEGKLPLGSYVLKRRAAPFGARSGFDHRCRVGIEVVREASAGLFL
jgi:hypothetical protein